MGCGLPYLTANRGLPTVPTVTRSVVVNALRTGASDVALQ